MVKKKGKSLEQEIDKDLHTLLIGEGIEYKLYLPGKETDYIQKKIYEENKPYELEMLQDISSRITLGDLVLDIGANIGNHTLYLAARGFKVEAFEANKKLYDILNVSVEVNNFSDKIKTHNIGLSDSEDVACFETIDESNLGGQSLTLGEGSIEVFPLGEFTFDQKIALIKIDVEGMETNVLRGASELIQNNRPLLYIEAINHVEFKAIFAELEKLGYVYWETFNATPTHLFLPQESISEKELIARDLYRNTYESYRMTQQLNLSKRVSASMTDLLNVYKREIAELKKDLSKQTQNYVGMEAHFTQVSQEKTQLMADKDRLEALNQEFSSSHDAMKEELTKKQTKLEGMSERNEKLKKLTGEQKEEIAKLRRSISYRLGKLLKDSVKSPIALIKLPYRLVKLVKEGLAKRKGKKKPLKKVEPKPTQKRTIREARRAVYLDQAKRQPLSKTKVAAIMDEFTYNSFKHECELVQLTPTHWKEEILEQRPDFVFVESAWQGKESLWQTKVSNASEELVALLEWCHQEKIPTLFWNKEDPVHFDTFIETASLVDFVFTTDIDCVAKYKKVLGHDRVNFLPFAAQPFVHNPVEVYDRKDAFNFAGSYYLRYPERQRDFKSLIDAVKVFKPVDIFDRNYDNPHPHYTFPDEYKPMILGKLAFEEIDKAYKGYRYGINMNTIKQSQTMFARRVYELLASNTITVSNFSRGLRLLFGDLVLASDSSQELSKRLTDICGSDLEYRKLRLLGLRKVMSEHTYADRLSYIVSQLSQQEISRQLPDVVIASSVHSQLEMDSLLEQFSQQNYEHKKLYVLKRFDGDIPSYDGVAVDENREHFVERLLEECNEQTLLGWLDPKDYYGQNYLVDLVYATTYSDAKAFGKASYYQYIEGKALAFLNENKQYHIVEQLSFNRSLIQGDVVSEKLINQALDNPDDNFTVDIMLAIDEFNYCQGGARNLRDEDKELVNDLVLSNQGISLKELSENSESMKATENLTSKKKGETPEIEASKLFEILPQPSSVKLNLELEEGKLRVISTLPEGKHAYIYAPERFTRQELNLERNSKFTLEGSGDLNLRTVFEFQDANGDKISHAMNAMGGTHALAIPNESRFIRFGIRVEGEGQAEINSLLLGESGEEPASIIGRSPYLVLTKQYPSYDDLYKYGFLHSRVRAYKEHGLKVEVFRITSKVDERYREFEGVDIASGDAELLDKTLASGKYEHVLVHLLDEVMWKVLEKHLENIQVTVWVHGAEAQSWKRRDFEFELMSEKEVERQKKLSEQRIGFWKKILSEVHPNLKLVFVSNYLLQTFQEDIGVSLDEKHYLVVHNFIDPTIFSYQKKLPEERNKVLSIRPYSKQVYANDLTVKAIELLAKEEFFNELSFTIVGDGELFDQTVASLRQYSNVVIEKRFLTHAEIAKYHKRHGVLLVPTRMDTQGVSRDEAMSSGLVAVTTNVAAIPEFVDTDCALITDPESPEGLAGAIKELYMNADKFLKLSKNGSKRVADQCGFDMTIGKEIALIQ